MVSNLKVFHVACGKMRQVIQRERAELFAIRHDFDNRTVSAAVATVGGGVNVARVVAPHIVFDTIYLNRVFDRRGDMNVLGGLDRDM